MGACFALLLLGCWGIASLARSVPEFIRQLDRGCATCDLSAFEPPLKPFGRQPELTREAPSVSRQQASTGAAGWVSAGPTAVRGGAPADTLADTPAEIPAGANRAPGKHAAWLDSGHLLDTIDLPGLVDLPDFGDLPANEDVSRSGAWPRAELAASGAVPGSGSWHPAPLWPTSSWPTSSWPPGRQPLGLQPLGLRPSGLWPSGLWPSGLWRDISIGTTARTVWADTLRSHDRLAMRDELERHFPQIGPDTGLAGAETAGESKDPLTGLPTDTTTRFTVNPDGVTVAGTFSNADGVSGEAAAARVREATAPPSGSRPPRANGAIDTDTFRAIAPYRLVPDVTPSIVYFRTAGAENAMRFVWPGARQNSAGVVAGVTFDPWPEPGSPVRFLNLRLAAQYVAHTAFSGIPHGAAGNNALVLSLWGALRF
jgi:hypothetical protein